MKKQKGFSLIELLIVVSIILIIAAIAIPNLIRARMSANEASSVGSLRTINTAEITFADAYPAIGFTDLISLGGATPCTPAPATGCLIDNVLATGTKSGYNFTVTPAGGAPNTNYTSLANPATLNSTGTQSFCSDETGVIEYLSGALGCTIATGTPLQ